MRRIQLDRVRPVSAPIDNASKAGAAQVLLVLLGGIVVSGGAFLLAQGAYTPSEAYAGHVVVGWGDAGAPPPGAVLVKATARASDATVAAFGVGPSPDDAGFSYWRVYVCAAPLADGGDPGPSFLPGATIVYDDDQVDACPAGAPQLEAWREGRADAPFLCACARDATCLQLDGGPSPTGLTLEAGQWSGSGCLPKTCIEIAGSSSWPAGCPQ